tara:strand:+ start:36 stop:602 length:567 start_codon:yes stop_codon:yes gene_type:complete
MKTKLKIILALIFFSSCNEIDLKFPQPVYLENLEKIPSNFQGSFERIDNNDTIKYKLFETFGLIDNDTLKLESDQLIIKHQNNNLFVNLKSNDHYNLYVLSRFNYFAADSLLLKTFSFSDDLDHHYNKEYTPPHIIKYMLNNKFSYVNPFIDSTIESSYILSDTLNVNQINTLLTWGRYVYRFKFNKH